MFCAVTSTVITNRLVQSSEISPPRPPGLAVSTKKPLPRRGTVIKTKYPTFSVENFFEFRNYQRAGSEWQWDWLWWTIRKYPALVASQALLSNYKTDTNNYFTISPLEMTNCFSGHSDTLLFIYMLKPKPQLTRHWDISNRAMNWGKIKNTETELVIIIILR